MDTRITYGYRRCPNLLDKLTSSDIRGIRPRKQDPPRCQRLLHCKHCPRLNKSGYIISTSTKRKYKIPKKVTCNSTVI